MAHRLNITYTFGCDPGTGATYLYRRPIRVKSRPDPVLHLLFTKRGQVTTKPDVFGLTPTEDIDQ